MIGDVVAIAERLRETPFHGARLGRPGLEDAPDPAHRLSDPVLVLDERERTNPPPPGPKPAPGETATFSLSREVLGEGERAHRGERLGPEPTRTSCRAAGERPARAVEAVAERVAPGAIDAQTSAGVSGASFMAVMAAIWIGWKVP